MALPCMYAKKVHMPVLFTSLPRRALLDRARASLRRCVLCHMTYGLMGPPLSARVLSRDLSRDRVARVLFSLACFFIKLKLKSISQ